MHMQVVIFNFTYADNNEKSGKYDAKKDTIWRHTMLFIIKNSSKLSSARFWTNHTK